jgi:dTDP-4-amino-4,6-dideoxygalactose transaminase
MNRQAVRSKDYFIPALPSLSPIDLIQQKRAPLPFPFDHPRYTDYYFGRNAVWQAIRILGLNARDRVLVPAYHHGVEVEAILEAGPAVDFYRVDTQLKIDLEDLEKKIGPETRAIYLIYYLGFPQPVDALLDLCRRRGLVLLEDCALSLFSRIDTRPMGSLGALSIFSFHKTLPLPNGGGLVINRSDLGAPPARTAPPLVSTLSHMTGGMMNRLKRDHPAAGRFLHEGAKRMASSLLKMGKIQRTSVANMEFNTEKIDWGMSAISKRILKSIDVEAVIKARRENFNYLIQRVDPRGKLPFESLPEGVCPLFFPIFTQDKERAEKELLARGVETVNFWGIPHPSIPAGVYAEAEYLRTHLLEIPIHQELHQGHLDYMISKLKEVF